MRWGDICVVNLDYSGSSSALVLANGPMVVVSLPYFCVLLASYQFCECSSGLLFHLSASMAAAK
jgi:hypothetical protein